MMLTMPFVHRLFPVALLLSAATLFAQPEPLSLPTHHGAMVLDLTGFKIVQSTAKPGGRELGLRVHDDGNTEALLFLFLTPEHPHGDASICREAELHQVQKDMGSNFSSVKLNPLGKDDDGFASMLVSGQRAKYLYGFRGVDDQCLSVEVYPDHGMALNLEKAASFLTRQQFDPVFVPTSKDKLFYAEILFRDQQYKAAVPIYADFLASTPSDAGHQMQRRVATDDMGMSLGISGDVDGARKLFQEASAKDPDYPMYYYNLACADAEQGHAKDAQHHLQQAFDRRANTLPGETLPDPAKDDSILKLKTDKTFWAFVQTLK